MVAAKRAARRDGVRTPYGQSAWLEVGSVKQGHTPLGKNTLGGATQTHTVGKNLALLV
ncbi:MAG TPA: hypothetical protein VMN99_09595 [Anaerolineales bacterium]|nr:hypothetical protein [Anaerolineales bacterium]